MSGVVTCTKIFICEFCLCRGYTFNANHPFHLHGHAFRVVAMERLNHSTEPHFVKKRDEAVMINYFIIIELVK